MNRLIAGALMTFLCSIALAQNTLPSPVLMGAQTSATPTKQTYTDAELITTGLTTADITDYRAKMDTIKGQWWGHVSPAEFMMYASENETDRKRYAKLYLESNFPKALAEKDAMKAMYQVAREIYAEQIGADAQPIAKRPALFVDIGCEDCKTSVLDLIYTNTSMVDIYLTGFKPDVSVEARNDTMIAWAKSLHLDPKRITLNDDNGLYQRKMGVTLESFHLITP